MAKSGLTLKIEGLDEVLKDIAQTDDKTIKNVAKAINDGTLMMRNHILRKLKQVSKGRTYVRGGRTIIASKPYDYPNAQSGDLGRSIVINKVSTAIGRLVGQVQVRGPANKYKWALEKGYMPRNLKPRPYMAPTLLKYEEKIWGKILKAIDKSLK